MKFYLILLVILLAAVVGLLVYGVVGKRIYPAKFADISADSIPVFESRAAELRAEVDTLKAILGRSGLIRRLPIARRVAEAESRLSELMYTIRRWREAKDVVGQGQAYRTCMLLYGQAQTACQTLSYDTLPPDSIQ